MPTNPELIDFYRGLPKVSLHDHLDGGLRATSLPQLAAITGHQLPAAPQDLAGWFFQAADSGHLSSYLETFDHTIACMQTAEQLRRVAREWVADQVADGVVVAEARWAPEQHTAGGLSMDEAVVAVGEGLREGMAAAQGDGKFIVATQLVTAMRQGDHGLEAAQLALRHRDDLVAGFDIAGPEAGFPPTLHQAAFDLLAGHHLPYTIHAGEEGDLSSVVQAIGPCRARRIGHGVGIAADLDGEVAAAVRELGVVLEVCPSSNLQTGVAEQMSQHPFGPLLAAGFAVTLNCDNRLMSATTLSREFALVAQAFGLGPRELYPTVVTAVNAAFLDDEQRTQALERVRAGWADVLG